MSIQVTISFALDKSELDHFPQSLVNDRIVGMLILELVCLHSSLVLYDYRKVT